MKVLDKPKEAHEQHEYLICYIANHDEGIQHGNWYITLPKIDKAIIAAISEKLCGFHSCNSITVTNIIKLPL